MRVVFRKTVVSDWRFDYLSGSHLQSQVVVIFRVSLGCWRPRLREYTSCHIQMGASTLITIFVHTHCVLFQCFYLSRQAIECFNFPANVLETLVGFRLSKVNTLASKSGAVEWYCCVLFALLFSVFYMFKCFSISFLYISNISISIIADTRSEHDVKPGVLALSTWGRRQSGHTVVDMRNVRFPVLLRSDVLVGVGPCLRVKMNSLLQYTISINLKKLNRTN